MRKFFRIWMHCLRFRGTFFLVLLQTRSVCKFEKIITRCNIKVLIMTFSLQGNHMVGAQQNRCCKSRFLLNSLISSLVILCLVGEHILMHQQFRYLCNFLMCYCQCVCGQRGLQWYLTNRNRVCLPGKKVSLQSNKSCRPNSSK